MYKFHKSVTSFLKFCIQIVQKLVILRLGFLLTEFRPCRRLLLMLMYITISRIHVEGTVTRIGRVPTMRLLNFLGRRQSSLVILYLVIFTNSL